MQDTEENRWLLLDMARAMGGYGYDEMWWADVYEPDDLEYSAPDLYEAFGTCSGTIRSSVFTTLCECATRVHILRNTGVLNFSDNSYARFANTRASSESAGSNIGTFAASA